MTPLTIFGAQSVALGVCHAIHTLYKEYPITAFLVTSLQDNPTTLAGLPVYEASSFPDKDVCVLIATPEDAHIQIIEHLKQHGFTKYICIDSRKKRY